MSRPAEGPLGAGLRRKIQAAQSINPIRVAGSLEDFTGQLMEARIPVAAVGDLCAVSVSPERSVRAQVVGFRADRTLLMPLEEPGALKPGAAVRLLRDAASAPAGPELLGRVLDGFGKPLDGLGPLHASARSELFRDPVGPMDRAPVQHPLVTGVRVIDALLPCGRGQRIGVFGGSGVGKSTLLAAMARSSGADVNIIAMIGERNREVREFIDQNLGPKGLARSVVVVSTSDRPAPMRVRAAFVAAAIADWFRAEGKHVLLIMDSATRLAMAQREIGLASGEPPSQKGYTPSVFQLLPRIFERAGSYHQGSITGIYTVLVEGDDMSEPVADAARSLLDGHIVLSRELAAANHFPAIDVLESVSRVSNAVAGPDQLGWAARLREALAEYRRSEDLINLGAYTAGANAKLDAAVKARPELERFLRQDLSAAEPLEQTLAELETLSSRL